MTDEDPIATFQSYLDISPFQRWLAIKAKEVSEGHLVTSIEWKEDFVSNPQTNSIHGGILAALIDLGGLYAVLSTKSVATATVDLRGDYHRPASSGQIKATSGVIKLGSKVSTAETRITNPEGKLIASGRGVYLMA